MSLHLFISCICALIFSEVYDTLIEGRVSQEALLVMSVWEGLIAVGIFLRSGLAYKLGIVTVLFMIAVVGSSTLMGGSFGYDFWIQGILSISCLILMLTPKMREAYRGWSLPRTPSYEID